MRKKRIFTFAIMVLCAPPLFAIDSADFDENYIVDFNDFLMFSDYWLYDYINNQQCNYWDLVVNGVIDFYDLDEIAESWLIDYNFDDFSDFGQYWRRVVDYRFQDDRFDLSNGGSLTTSGDGFVDFSDFSVFSSQWNKRTDCCDGNSISVDPQYIYNWQRVDLADIDACGDIDCWFGEFCSDPCYDGCGHDVIMGCEETPDFDYYCAFNYRYDGQEGFRVGLCVYECGINEFEIIKNKGRCRMILARHRTRDKPPQDPLCNPPNPPCSPDCDEGTIGKYNWQIVLTDLFTLTKAGICRESYTKPSYLWGWQSSEGEQGPCQYIWWQN